MASPVHLLTLELQRFRNHHSTRLAPGAAPFVVLTGPNGAGKTNVLEAVSLLAVGRGMRGAALSQMAAQGTGEGFAVRAQLLPDPGLPPIELRTWTGAAAPERRLLRINEAPAALSRLSDWASQLWLTPAMDRLFADSAGARRRFLDRLVLALDPAHAGHASRYEAAMRARSRLLAADGPADPAWLSALESQMALHGAALAEARAATVTALDAALAEAPNAAFPRPSLQLTEADQSELAAMLRAGRSVDRAAGRALRGPHRQDLQVFHAEKAMPAALASTGEQKALLIGMLLAHGGLVAARSGRVPLLLLDEAAAHLDLERRRALFDRLARLGGQAWLTGTDVTLFDGLAAARYAVREGAAAPA